MTGLYWNLKKAHFLILFPQLVANHVERMQQEEACPHKVLNHVKELAEKLFKNVCSQMRMTRNTYYSALILLLSCQFLFVLCLSLDCFLAQFMFKPFFWLFFLINSKEMAALSLVSVLAQLLLFFPHFIICTSLPPPILCLFLPLGESLPCCSDAQSPATIRKWPKHCKHSETFPFTGRCCSAAIHGSRCCKAQDCTTCGQVRAQGDGAIWAPTGWAGERTEDLKLCLCACL